MTIKHDQCQEWELEIIRLKEYIAALESLRDAFTARHKENIDQIITLRRRNEAFEEVITRLNNGYNVWTGGLLHERLKELLK